MMKDMAPKALQLAGEQQAFFYLRKKIERQKKARSIAGFCLLTQRFGFTAFATA
ncbi:MAG: hypothetical protein V4669_19825 [Pseudomonadota bacterium]